jgi:hypothetical protein
MHTSANLMISPEEIQILVSSGVSFAAWCVTTGGRLETDPTAHFGFTLVRSRRHLGAQTVIIYNGWIRIVDAPTTIQSFTKAVFFLPFPMT